MRSPGTSAASLDTVLMRIVDVFFAFPFYVMVIVLVFVLRMPASSSIYLAIAAVSWVSYAKIVRGEVIVAKPAGLRRRGTARRDVAHAASSLRHIAPNVTVPGR